jgi:hypothetical protein
MAESNPTHTPTPAVAANVQETSHSLIAAVGLVTQAAQRYPVVAF